MSSFFTPYCGKLSAWKLVCFMLARIRNVLPAGYCCGFCYEAIIIGYVVMFYWSWNNILALCMYSIYSIVTTSLQNIQSGVLHRIAWLRHKYWLHYNTVVWIQLAFGGSPAQLLGLQNKSNQTKDNTMGLVYFYEYMNWCLLGIILRVFNFIRYFLPDRKTQVYNPTLNL